MRILSIDPGISGGLALLEFNAPNHPQVLEALDMPTMARKKDGSGHMVNPVALSLEIARLTPTLVVLERVTGMAGGPGQNKMGTSGAFNFGMSFGIVIGCCGMLPQIYVTPASWKKRMHLTGASSNNNDYARTLALQLFPYLGEQLKRKKDLGRAEAILIGVDYCRQLIAEQGELAGRPGMLPIPKSFTRDWLSA